MDGILGLPDQKTKSPNVDQIAVGHLTTTFNVRQQTNAQRSSQGGANPVRCVYLEGILSRLNGVFKLTYSHCLKLAVWRDGSFATY